MKKTIFLLLAATLLFAQDETQAQNGLPQTPQEEQAPPAQEETAEEIEQETSDEESEEVKEQVVHAIFFVGLQTGNVPEIRETFENMVRTNWGLESEIRFVPRNVTLRIRDKLFLDGKVFIDSVFFAELQKHDLQNTVALLISADNYSIRAERRRIIGAGVVGRLDAHFMFYDVAANRELLVARTSNTALVKKPPIWWKSPQERVNISANDRRTIISRLLESTVKNGFEMMKIAVSLKNNAN